MGAVRNFEGQGKFSRNLKRSTTRRGLFPEMKTIPLIFTKTCFLGREACPFLSHASCASNIMFPIE